MAVCYRYGDQGAFGFDLLIKGVDLIAVDTEVGTTGDLFDALVDLSVEVHKDAAMDEADIITETEVFAKAKDILVIDKGSREVGYMDDDGGADGFHRKNLMVDKMYKINIKRVFSIPLLMALMSSATLARCQTWSEWFRQKKTQEKYLLEQIAAVQLYAGYLKKGYEVARSGWNTVSDLANGEFSLHNNFISSLATVNPVIGRSVRVAEIVAFQLEIMKLFSTLKWKQGLSLAVFGYIGEVEDKVLAECSDDLDGLFLVVTSGQLEMGDAERLSRLEEIHSSMQDRAGFVRDFAGQVGIMQRIKLREEKSVDNLMRLYEVH